MNKYLKIFWAAVFCIAFTVTSIASAAQKSDAQTMKIFRDSMYDTINDNQKIFRNFMLFIVPGFQSELDFMGHVNNQTFDFEGSFGVWISADNGRVTPLELPFYVHNNEKTLNIYYKSLEDNQWKKYAVPSLAGSLADAVLTPTKKEIDEEISRVKSVSILHENDSRRTLLVTLDGKKLADEFKLHAEKNPADKGTAEDAELQADIVDYIYNALRKADIWYVWTIDKKNHRTKSLNLDLSNVIREAAKSALNDSTQKYPDFFNEILETLAFYSECKIYATVLDPSVQSSLTIPQEVIDNAVEVKDVVSNDQIETATQK